MKQVSNKEMLILVDENDREYGLSEKMKAHELGLLHRAFSVFIFNNAGKMLLHKRAEHKYHSPGLWTNACCSHPRPEESNMDAARRRLVEEMGFDCELEHQFHFIYKAEFDNGLTEHELDHVFTGVYDGLIEANAEEVSEFGYYDVEWITEDMEKNPKNYTIWFRIAFPKLIQHLQNQKAVA